MSASAQRMDGWHGPGATCPATPPSGSLKAIQTYTKIKFRAGSIGGDICGRSVAGHRPTKLKTCCRSSPLQAEKDHEMCPIPCQGSGCVTGLLEWTLCDWTA